MKIKIVLRQILLSLILLLGIVGSANLAAAEKTQTWIVRSEYQSPIPGREKSTIWWQFEQQILAHGEVLVVVTDLDQRVRTRAELYYNRQGALSQADCYRQRRGEEICDARLYDTGAPVLINQSLVPGDWLNHELPFVPRAEVGEYSVKEMIGITGFSSRLLVQEQEMGLAKARSAGMIGSDNEALVGNQNPYLITVSKVTGSRSDAVLLRQLWLVGDNFWLYEEKEGRQSWRHQQKSIASEAVLE